MQKNPSENLHLLRAESSSATTRVPDDVPLIPDDPALALAELDQHQREDVLREASKNVVYGEGIGNAAFNVGSVIVFPPLLLYHVGKFGASLAGYEIDPVDALPQETGDAVDSAFSAVISVPGRIISEISGEKFRGKGKALPIGVAARSKIQKYLLAEEL